MARVSTASLVRSRSGARLPGKELRSEISSSKGGLTRVELGSDQAGVVLQQIAQRFQPIALAGDGVIDHVGRPDAVLLEYAVHGAWPPWNVRCDDPA